MKSAKIKNVLVPCLMFIASAVMLTVIQPPFSWAPLAPVALMPFILACSPKAKPRRLAIIANLISLCYWLGNLYWVQPITWPGWLAFCLYTAVLWPILALSLRFCRIKKIPLFLAAPLLFVGAERLQGVFLGGFFWRFLAHSQYANITLIQIADIFGAAGVSFLIAMVNGLLAELIIAARNKNILKISTFVKAALVCAALVAAAAYGRWRIIQSDKFIEAGPLLGSVQSNVPQSVKDSGSPGTNDEIFAALLQNSKQSAKAGAELIVWPETMVHAHLDARVLRILEPSHRWKILDKALREHSKEVGFVLVGAYGGIPDIQQTTLAAKYNSAFLYGSSPRQVKKQYNKIHLVPFGEVVPFKNSSPWLYNLLMKFTPYDFDYSLDAGSEYTVFEMTSGKEPKRRVYRFSVMICYEDTVPSIARRFAIDHNGHKRLDWLVNISNDGWFVQFKSDPAVRQPHGRALPSTELAQHTAVCVFRAVENRLAVLRSVNTGISCLIDSLGRIRNGYTAASADFPLDAMARKAVPGWFVDRVPIDKRTTFFSKYGQWLDFSCALCLFMPIIVSFWERFFFVKQSKKHTRARK